MTQLLAADMTQLLAADMTQLLAAYMTPVPHLISVRWRLLVLLAEMSHSG